MSSGDDSASASDDSEGSGFLYESSEEEEASSKLRYHQRAHKRLDNQLNIDTSLPARLCALGILMIHDFSVCIIMDRNQHGTSTLTIDTPTP